MPISFACRCGQRIKAKDSFAGRRSKCPACHADLLVPIAGDPHAKAANPQQPSSPGAGDVIEDVPRAAPGIPPLPKPTPPKPSRRIDASRWVWLRGGTLLFVAVVAASIWLVIVINKKR